MARRVVIQAYVEAGIIETTNEDVLQRQLEAAFKDAALTATHGTVMTVESVQVIVEPDVEEEDATGEDGIIAGEQEE